MMMKSHLERERADKRDRGGEKERRNAVSTHQIGQRRTREKEKRRDHGKLAPEDGNDKGATAEVTTDGGLAGLVGGENAPREGREVNVVVGLARLDDPLDGNIIPKQEVDQAITGRRQINLRTTQDFFEEIFPSSFDAQKESERKAQEKAPKGGRNRKKEKSNAFKLKSLLLTPLKVCVGPSQLQLSPCHWRSIGITIEHSVIFSILGVNPGRSGSFRAPAATWVAQRAARRKRERGKRSFILFGENEHKKGNSAYPETFSVLP